ncbi:MAG: UDP-N-acetylglucosamine 2-epimerase (non-hydrolyzing) [Bacillota bacterium]|nr:UDP-N-acetylglucosamine 2-epimerase (non-hydrolyzing) [Bacillota bacterium]
MTARIRVMTVFGTRPEAIKMAPLVQALRRVPDEIEPIVCVTAQHREMLDQVLEIFDIRPDYDLNVMQPRQSLIDITTRVLTGMDDVLADARPDIVLVHGDTTTTFVAALAAFYRQIKVGHVEAGLRTWKKYAPFPEELNRQLTGVLADLHFAPTAWAAENLRRENKPEATIFVTGNTVIDALHTTVRENWRHPVMDRLDGRDLVLVTAHRRENLGAPMRRMFRAIRRLADAHPDIAVVYPVHLNPAVREAAQEVLEGHPRIHLIEPLDVLDFHNFLARARLVLTDSGGVQEEAPAFGVPVLVMRETTERPEGVEAGTLKLVGTDEERIFQTAHQLLTDAAAYAAMAKAANPFGDGRASERIVAAILYAFGRRSAPPAPFVPVQTVTS